MKIPKETDLPHSESDHNPLWCGGDQAGQCHGDDPCWSCISWAFARLDDLAHAVELHLVDAHAGTDPKTYEAHKGESIHRLAVALDEITTK